MTDSTSYPDHDQNLRAAVVDAERIITETRGTNLDPIIQVLDERLLGPDGAINETMVAHLRRDLVTSLGLSDTDVHSGQQLAAKLLCTEDDRIRAPILAAAGGGASALVPVIAATLFGAVNEPVLAIASPLAALIVVRGLGAFCEDMGHPLPFDRPGPVS